MRRLLNYLTGRGTVAPVVFDGRNLYDPALLEAEGIAYYAIGRGRRIAAG